MGNNNVIKLIIIVGLLFFVKCTSPISRVDISYKKAKSSFGVEMKILGLTNHFPKVLNTKEYYFEVLPPSTNCIKQYGYFYLVDEISENHKKLDSVRYNNLYSTPYVSDNIIINLSTLKRDVFSVKKCNKWYSKKLPIPYFESYNFGLGKKVIEEKVKGDILYNYIYTIPKDLEVYVIKAEAGDFWKESCNEKRPKSLKEWQHGYSKGIAVSEEENVIVFWTMLW